MGNSTGKLQLVRDQQVENSDHRVRFLHAIFFSYLDPIAIHVQIVQPKLCF